MARIIGRGHSFDDVLKELKIEEDDLKKMVSEGEIRAFRDQNTMKFKKRGFITGWVGDFKMATELIITFGVFEMIRQVFTISYKFHLLRLIRHKNILYLNNTI